nr:APC family permease [Candidatus Njordarchaeota archaeon]
MAKKKPTLFAREATGLVREVRPLDSVIFNMIAIIGVGPVGFLTTLSLFPQANLPVTILIFLIPAFFTFMTYRELSVAMPRSGGDYIYVTRVINPAVGFVGSVLAWMGALLSLGFILYMFVIVLDTVLALGLAADPVVFILVGTVFLVLMTLQSIFKSSGFKIFRYTFIIAAIFTAVTIIALLTVNLPTFIAGWDATFGVLGLSYANLPLVAAATPGEGGAVFSTGFTLGATFMAVLFPMTYILGFGSTNVGGELKDYKKSLTYALIVTLLGMTAFYLVLCLATFNAFGQDFLNAYGWLYWYGPPALKQYPPALIFFMNFGVDPTLLLLSAIGMLLWAYMMVPAALIIWSRYVFAWSFDRVTPLKFGDVSERTRSPVWALLTSVVVVWFGFIGSAFNLALVGTVYYISLYVWTAIVGISGILLAKRKKEIYQKSLVRGTIAGIPRVTLYGVITALYFIISIPLLFLYPTVLIPQAPVGAIITLIAIAVAAFIYFNAKRRNKAQGIDVEKIFKEIPPE